MSVIRKGIISMMVLLAAASIALADDWRVFGAHGTIQITPKGGSPIIIDNSKSPMMKIPVEATIQVKGQGKLVVVALKSRKGYEIGDNSTAFIDSDSIRALKGSVVPKSGFAKPTGKDGKMGGIVMRSISNHGGCLKLLSPAKTTILGLTPELRWENHCGGLSSLTLTIISDERVIHTAEVMSQSFYRVPENLLKRGNRYLWMIDGGTSYDVSSSVFVVAADKQRDEVLRRMKRADAASTPEDRLEYIFYLSDMGFSEIATEEIRKLRSAFPEAAGLTELL